MRWAVATTMAVPVSSLRHGTPMDGFKPDAAYLGHWLALVEGKRCAFHGPETHKPKFALGTAVAFFPLAFFAKQSSIGFKVSISP